MAGEDDLDEFLEPAAYEDNLLVEPSLFSDDDVDIDFNNILIFNKLPIYINKIVEKINISFLKSVYQFNSQISFKDYILNLNDKTMNLKSKKLRLTEKEVNIITFLFTKKIPQKTSILQKEIWGYDQNLETHTVETHIYRLRKKINNFFNDPTILKKNKDGYLL